MYEKFHENDRHKVYKSILAKILVLEMEKRKLVVPGETIISGDEFLPGEGVRREGEDVVAGKFGLADFSDKLVKIIPISGRYVPRRGNVIVGQVVGMNFKGWMIDFGGYLNGFLNVSEVPRYIERGELREYLDFGDSVCAKIFSADSSSVELTIKIRGLGKLNGGQIISVNPNKVPRIIGKEGSMVNLIKDASDCDITVGQNGQVWIKSSDIENELIARKIIDFICENSYMSGLTGEVESFIKKEFGKDVKAKELESENNEAGVKVDG